MQRSKTGRHERHTAEKKQPLIIVLGSSKKRNCRFRPTFSSFDLISNVYRRMCHPFNMLQSVKNSGQPGTILAASCYFYYSPPTTVTSSIVLTSVFLGGLYFRHCFAVVKSSRKSSSRGRCCTFPTWLDMHLIRIDCGQD